MALIVGGRVGAIQFKHLPESQLEVFELVFGLIDSGDLDEAIIQLLRLTAFVKIKWRFNKKPVDTRAAQHGAEAQPEIEFVVVEFGRNRVHKNASQTEHQEIRRIEPISESRSHDFATVHKDGRVEPRVTWQSKKNKWLRYPVLGRLTNRPRAGESSEKIQN